MHALIADSPLHRLFLEQWLKEEELITLRVRKNERRIVTLHEEITALYFSFFAFNSIILLLLFTPSSTPAACRLPWIPCLCSLACSTAIAWAISYKTDTRGHLEMLVGREKQYGVVLVERMEELRKKGMELDVMKEVDTLRRTKRVTRVEKERTSPPSKKDLKMLFLFGVSCVVTVVTRFKLCN